MFNVQDLLQAITGWRNSMNDKIVGLVNPAKTHKDLQELRKEFELLKVKVGVLERDINRLKPPSNPNIGANEEPV